MKMIINNNNMNYSILLLLLILQAIPYLKTQAIELGGSSFLTFTPQQVGKDATTFIRQISIPHTVPVGGHIDITYPEQWTMVEAANRTYVDCSIFIYNGNKVQQPQGQISVPFKILVIPFSLNAVSKIDISCSSLKNPGSTFSNTLELHIYDNLQQLLSYKSYQVDLIPQTLPTVSFIPSSLNTYDTSSLSITFTPMNKMQIGSKIIIIFPLINPQAPQINQLTMLDATSQCTGIQGIDSDLSCIFQSNQLTITNGFKTTGNLNLSPIQIQITNFRNPQSTQPITEVQLITKDINEGLIDEYLTGTITVNYPSNLQSVQIISTNYQIRQTTDITFIITPTTFLNPYSVVQITFPRLFDLTDPIKVYEEVEIAGMQNTNPGMNSVYSNYVFTIRDLNAVYSTNVAYILKFSGIKNYDQVQISESFQVKLLDQQMFPIQQTTTNLMYQTTPGGLNNVAVVFNTTFIQQKSEVVIGYNVGDYLNSNAIISIIFPDDFIVADLSDQICPQGTILEGIDVIAFCRISDNTFTLTEGFPSGIQIDQFIKFKITGITNPTLSQKPTQPLNIQMKQVDALISQDNTKTFEFQSGTITISKFDSISKTTNALTDYTIQFSNQNQLPIDSSFLITFPNDITLPLSLTVGINCIFVQGFQQGSTCRIISNQLEVRGVNIQSLVDKNTIYIIIIKHIYNPRSLKALGSLNIKSLNGIYLIDESDTFPQLLMTTPNQFQGVQFDNTKQILGQQTNYQFVITSGEGIQAGDYLRIQFPAALDVSAARYEGQTSEFIVLQNTVQIQFDQNIDASRGFIINILDVNNPYLQEHVTPFIFTLKSTDDYIITQTVDSIGVLAFTPKQMTSFRVSIDNLRVAEVSPYTFKLTTSFIIPINGYIIVSVPQSLSIQEGLCTFSEQLVETICTQKNSTAMQIQLPGYQLSQGEYNITIQVRNKMNSDIDHAYYNVQTNTQSHIPIENGQFFSNFNYICDTGCVDCVNSASHCITCVADHIQMQNKCIMNCGIGYVLNGNKCQKCSHNCTICDHQHCLVCDSGFLLNSEFQCFIKTYDNLNSTSEKQTLIEPSFSLIESSFSGDFQNLCYISFYLALTLMMCIFSKIVYKKAQFFYSLQSWVCLIELPVSLMLVIFALQNEQYIQAGVVGLFMLWNHIPLQILAVRAIMNQLQIDQMHKSVGKKSFQAYFIQVIMIIWNFKFFLMFQSGWSNEKEAHQKKIYSFQMVPFIKYYSIQFVRILIDLVISIILFLYVPSSPGEMMPRWAIWPFDFVIFYCFNATVNIINYIILVKEQKIRMQDENLVNDLNDKKKRDLEVQSDNQQPPSDDPMVNLNKNIEFLKLPFHRNKREDHEDLQKQNQNQIQNLSAQLGVYKPILKREDQSVNGSMNSLCISEIHSQIALDKQNKPKQIELNQIQEENCSAEKGNSDAKKMKQLQQLQQDRMQYLNPPNFEENE